MGAELMKLKAKEDDYATTGGGVNWALGGTAKRAKPKRDRGGGIVSPATKSVHRDLVNPSQPARRSKRKAIAYKGLTQTESGSK